jgi:type II secretory pathway pseudopilin PulG
MGQQQLLLLVLATVIVGLATVAGINAFEQNQKQASADAMTQEAMRIASDIQAYALKPEQMGGLASDKSLGDINFDNLGQYNVSGSGPYEGPNGDYEINGSASSDACPNGGGDLNVLGENTDNGVEVCVEITGTGSNEIATGTDFGS